MYFGLKRENRLRDEGKRDEIIGGEGPFDEKAQGISGNGRFRTVEEARVSLTLKCFVERGVVTPTHITPSIG